VAQNVIYFARMVPHRTPRRCRTVFATLQCVVYHRAARRTPESRALTVWGSHRRIAGGDSTQWRRRSRLVKTIVKCRKDSRSPEPVAAWFSLLEVVISMALLTMALVSLAGVLV